MPRSAQPASLYVFALLASGCLGASVVGGPPDDRAVDGGARDGSPSELVATDDRATDDGAVEDLPDGSCAGHQVLCEDGCTDLAVDPAHCGGCAVACAAGQSCVLNICEQLCPGAQVACDNRRCFDLQTDAANCGVCGQVCASGGACVAGACTVVR